MWAQTYPIGPNGGDITSLKQTADGGYVAAGNSYGPGSAANGALVLKLDNLGNVQWQRIIGPAGSTLATFNAVQQTSDGGYVATGDYDPPVQGLVPAGMLVVKLDSSGNLQWQQGFNDFGSQSGSASANSIVQTPDGGYLAAGHWSGPGFSPTAGALLLKLDSSGNFQWQKAYSGGTYCYFNGYNEVCAPIGALIYSVHPASDGGYVLAGAGDLELLDSVPLVPWLAKVNLSGNLLWQNFYYQVYSTGRPLSQYFASAAPARDRGFVAVGFTEDYAKGLSLLYAVKTDSSGLCGKSCREVHSATPLTAINPALTQSTLALPVSTTAIPGVSSTSKTRTTAIKVKQDCSLGR